MFNKSCRILEFLFVSFVLVYCGPDLTLYPARFEVLTAVFMKVQTFWGVMPDE